ncbi:MAG: Gfo/Idh/MocA family oxidoreductase [Planctomycetota bacterium]
MSNENLPCSSPHMSATSRRDFLKTSAALSVAAFAGPLVLPRGVFAAGSDAIRVGVIGCGGRGTGAASDCVKAAPGVKITALGDLFVDRLESSKKHLAELGPDKFDVSAERCFTGFDAYAKVIASDVDLVILATPPGFRPLHLRAAVEAGKHVFAEKPIAVDPAGVRSVIASSEIAAVKKLGIVAGTQRRHQQGYLQTMRRIHDGAIGEILAAQCYWNQGGLWTHERQARYSDMEWQVRNWLYFTWLSGDHIVEQHVHNLDVINWALRANPLKAIGLGGRQARVQPIHGNIYDHFCIEYEYPGGVRVHSMCRQIDGTAGRVAERVVGALGSADPAGRIEGKNPYRHRDHDARNPYEQEHADLIESIRGGTPLNHARRIAESTLTAIMGRMSAYTGQEVSWDQALNSRLDLSPRAYEFGANEVPVVAIPGQTPLV